jgi:hypothetical protein
MQQANHSAVQANTGTPGALPRVLPRKTASSDSLRTVWKATKAILSGVAFTLVGLVTYALLHGLINYQPQHAEGLRIILYSPWFWLSALGGCVFGVYLVTSENKPLWKTARAILSGVVFTIIGLVSYMFLYAFVNFSPRHPEALQEWANSPWLWIFTVGGFAFGVYLVITKMEILRQTVKAIFAGFICTFLGYRLYFWVFWRSKFSPSSAIGLNLFEAITIYSPWFWVFTAGGFVLGVYLALKLRIKRTSPPVVLDR